MESRQRQQQKLQQQRRVLQYMSTFKNQNPKAVVDQIRAGDDMATQAVNLLDATSHADIAFRTKLCQAGLLDVVLDFLDQCNTGKSFQDVLVLALQTRGGRGHGNGSASRRSGRGSSSSTGGNLAFAHVWTNCLMNCLTKNAMRPESLLQEYRVHVAQRLAPLAECMSCTKLFFHSRQEYLQNMLYFTGLIANLVLSPAAVVPILMNFQNDMIRSWCVQALFMPLNRPDVVAEMVELNKNINRMIPNHFPILQTTACSALQEFCDAVPRESQTGQNLHPTAAGKEELKRLGNLPAVDPLYYQQDQAAHGSGEQNLNSIKTFATGLLDVVKDSHEALSMNNGRGYDSLFYCWSQLLYSFCPVKGELGGSASRNLVSLGLSEHAMANPKFAESLLEAIHCYAVRPSSSALDNNSGEPVNMPQDVVLASLLSVGFGEMLLRLLVKHNTNSGLVDITEHHLHAVGSVALASKTNKALMKRMTLLKKELDRVKGQTAMTKRNIAKCIQTMDSILEKATMGAAETMMDNLDLANALAVGICRWCQKEVPSGELKRCGKCHRSTYCSKECQTKDWKEGGHKQLCKVMMTNSAKAEASGASKKEVRSERKHEENLSMAGNLLFNKRMEHILIQAGLRGYVITDCVTIMDFRFTPATITVMTIPEFLAGHCDPSNNNRPFDAAQHAHTKMVCERNQANGAITLACAHSGRGEVLLKTFPNAADAPWKMQQLALGFRYESQIQNLGTAAKNAMIQKLVEQQFNGFY